MSIKQVSLLGIRLAALTMEEVLLWVAQRIEAQLPTHIITANAEIIYRAWQKPQWAALLSQADLLTPDGAGVLWAARQLQTPLPERVTGVDLTQKLLALAPLHGWRVYFLGARPEVVEKAVLRTLSQEPHLAVCGYQHGYFAKQEIDQVVSNIDKAKPDIVLVALGSPRQEYFIREHLATLPAVVIGVGGSFDILAGVVSRAPLWMQRCGCEWLYRLCREPHRWKRMLVLPCFLKTVWQRKRRLDKT